MNISTVGRAKGVHTPILIEPDDGLYLWDWGEVGEDDKLVATSPVITRKFIRCFQETWGQLPDRDRDALTGFWGSRTRPLDEACGKPYPAIEFNSFCLPNYFTAACKRGWELLFSVTWLRIIKPNPAEIRHVIAHELGHAISYVNKWDRQHDCMLMEGRRKCPACEMQAWSYMAAWGFDPFYQKEPGLFKQWFSLDKRVAKRKT